jgi:hypothetical protein
LISLALESQPQTLAALLQLLLLAAVAVIHRLSQNYNLGQSEQCKWHRTQTLFFR